MKRTYVFTDNFHEPAVREVHASDGTDIEKAFSAACEEAKAKDARCMSYDIPANILASHGLIMTAVETVPVGAEYLKKDCELVTVCTCSDCSAYEDGYCFKYGGSVDGSSMWDDCLHGTGGERLTYDGDRFSQPIRTHLEPADAARVIMTEKDEDFEDIRDEILDYFDGNDPFASGEDPSLWDFETDEW